MLVIFASRKKNKKLSAAYIYELDLGLNQTSEGKVLSLELDH